MMIAILTRITMYNYDGEEEEEEEAYETIKEKYNPAMSVWLLKIWIVRQTCIHNLITPASIA